MNSRAFPSVKYKYQKMVFILFYDLYKLGELFLHRDISNLK